MSLNNKACDHMIFLNVPSCCANVYMVT